MLLMPACADFVPMSGRTFAVLNNEIKKIRCDVIQSHITVVRRLPGLVHDGRDGVTICHQMWYESASPWCRGHLKFGSLYDQADTDFIRTERMRALTFTMMTRAQKSLTQQEDEWISIKGQAISEPICALRKERTYSRRYLCGIRTKSDTCALTHGLQKGEAQARTKGGSRKDLLPEERVGEQWTTVDGPFVMVGMLKSVKNLAPWVHLADGCVDLAIAIVRLDWTCTAVAVTCVQASERL